MGSASDPRCPVLWPTSQKALSTTSGSFKKLHTTTKPSPWRPELLPGLPGVCSALTGKREFPKASGILVGDILGDFTKEGVDGA